MRQNVPLRKPGSTDATTDKAGQSIDEWLDAAIAEQSRRSAEKGSGERGSTSQDASASTKAEPEAQTGAEPHPTPPSARSSAALKSMTSWIERAQEELSGPALAPTLPSTSRQASAPAQHSAPYDALSAVERLSSDTPTSEAQAAQEEAFRNLENRIREIAERLEAPPQKARKIAPGRLEDAVAEIRARQAALDESAAATATFEAVVEAPEFLPPPPAMPAPFSAPRTEPIHEAPTAARAVETPAREIQPAAAPLDTPALAGLRRDLDRVQSSLAGLATRADLGSIERSVTMLAGEIAEARAEGRNLTPVEAQIEALHDEVRRLAGPAPVAADGMAKLARDVDIVSHKLDIVAASGIDPAAVDSLAREVADVKRMLGGLAVPSDIGALNDQLNEMKLELARIGSRQIDAEDFSSLRVAVEEMRDVLSAGLDTGTPAVSSEQLQRATRDELQPIASMLVMLIEKIERLERNSGDPEALDQIERQIAGLSSAISSTRSADPALSELSHAMQDLMHEITSWRRGTIELAEEAARNAVAMTLHAMRGEFVPAERQNASRAAEHGAAESASRITSQDRPTRGSEAVTDRSPPMLGELRADPPQPTREASEASLRRLNEALALAPGFTEADRPLPRASDSEVLLEPGAGRPHGALPAEPEQESPADQRDIKASFIAAARRAAQAAAADSDREAGRPERPNVAPIRDGEGSAGVRAMLDRLRRPLLVSAAALVFAIGAYRLVSDLTDQPPEVVAINAPSGSTIAAAPQAPSPSAADLPEPTTTAALKSPAEGNAPSSAQAATIGSGPASSGGRTEADTSSLASMAPPASEAGSPKQGAQLPPGAAPAAPPAKAPGQVQIPEATAAALPPTLRQAALNGDPAAMYELASRMMEGRGIPRDQRAAAAMFEKAAEKNLAPAQYRVGNAFEKGVGVQRDLEAARRWYLRAAESGNTRAMHNLAVLMAEGGSGKPDYAGAMAWFQRAAEHGIRDSQFNLAVLFARGLGTPQDLVQSYTWFSIAASQGDEEAKRKRDEVATRLKPADLTRAKGMAEHWRVSPSNPKANEVPVPPTGWSSDSRSKRSGRA